MGKLGFVCLALALGITGNAFAKGNDLTVTVGADVTEWDSATVEVPGVIIPVGGSGQLQGNFTIVDRADGVQIGLRATDRTDGLLPPATGNKKGSSPGIGESVADFE